MPFRDLYPQTSAVMPFGARPAKTASDEAPGVAIGTKTSPVYLVHSYPTKVPPEAIAPFIQHFTRRGDVVCDPFAGSGMTGVAARRLRRHALLSDLSPLAVHLATNVNTPCSSEALRAAASAVLAACREIFDHWYGTSCTMCGSPARLNWLVWGDTIACPTCGTPIRTLGRRLR